MKRRNFLLSIPLIGLAVKAISKPTDNKPPDWVKDYCLVKTDSVHHKYPLTEKEAYWTPHTENYRFFVYKVKSVKKSGNRKYDLIVESKASEDTTNAIRIGTALSFQKGGFGVVTQSDNGHITIVTGKRRLRIDTNDLVLISGSTYSEGTSTQR